MEYLAQLVPGLSRVALMSSGLAEALAWQTEALILGATGSLIHPTHGGVPAANRVPVAFFSKESAQARGLLSYGLSYNGLGRETATLLGKILKAARPADLPVEQPTEYELVVNQTTTRALGIAIPGNRPTGDGVRSM
jgi:putative ABC transport system substrate-binding protein